VLREILAVGGLSEQSADFQRSIIKVADRLGINPSHLAAVIKFESGFDPAIKNTASGAVGLIQFMPGPNGSAARLGTTVQQLARMSAVEQMSYVERYYRAIIKWKGNLDSIEDVYLAVFGPAGIGSPMDSVLYASPTKAYEQNMAMDLDGDGTITMMEATQPVRIIMSMARKKPPLLVEMNSPPASGGGLALLVLGSVITMAAAASRRSRR